MSMLSLKVNVCTQKTVKTMQFLGTMSVFEVCAEIRAKLGDSAGGEDHSLFSPEQSRWLAPTKTLIFYDLKSGDLIEFKKKHRMLRVKLMDETVKTVLIDDSLPAQMLVQSVCAKIGILNADEFSLAMEKEVEQKKSSKKHGSDIEDGNWLNPEKSLPEQGVKDTDMLILKKKFFFSDSNIDRNDPIQLNLLYVQARDAIIAGTHPCTQEEAVQFAALQCQIMHGSHDDNKHKPGFLNLKEFLPDEYRKSKELEKKIYAEHRKLQGMTEINAKYRYVQLCRSLKTYGVTFFLVKEKDPKKQKLVSRLLGITKESIMRMDTETKEMIKTWPLTSLRRWAASPNTFTLDFGDYQDAFYSVQTMQGDAISQLIAGYIEIIVKRKKDAERAVAHGTEEVAVSEEILRPAKAQAISVTPAQANHAVETKLSHQGVVAETMTGSQRIVMNTMQAQPVSVTRFNAVQATVGTDSLLQQAVKQRIASGFATMNAVCAEMSVPVSLPTLGTDAASMAWKQQTYDTSIQSLQAYISSHLAATCSLVNQCTQDPDKVDFNILAADVATVTSNLNHIATATRMLAALGPNEADNEALLEAAKNVSLCTSKMLTTVQTCLGGAPNRPELYSSAQAVTTACTQLLQRLRALEVSSATQKSLMDAVRAVSAATQELVNRAKTVAAEAQDKDSRAEIIEAVKSCALSASQLAVCTAIVTPVITNSLCADQLINSTVLMRDAIDRVLASGQKSSAGPAVEQLSDGAKRVNEAIALLLARARNPDGSEQGGSAGSLDGCVDTVLLTSAALKATRGDANAIIAGVKAVTVASSSLVNMLKQRAGEDGPDKNRLIATARAIAEATNRMVGCAKESARDPGNDAKHLGLQQSVDELRRATGAAGTTDPKDRAFKKLYTATKNLSAGTTQLMGASTSAALSNEAPQTQNAVNKSIKKMLEANTALATALRTARDHPQNMNAQMNLLSVARTMQAPASTLLAASKETIPHIGDLAVRAQLEQLTALVEEEIENTVAAIKATDELGDSFDLDSAIYTVKSLKTSHASAIATLASLKAGANQTYVGAQMELRTSCKKLATALTALMQSSAQANDKAVCAAAKDTASVLKVFAHASRDIAATCSDVVSPAERETVKRLTMDNCDAVLGKADNLLNAARDALASPATPTSRQQLNESAKQLNQAMTKMLEDLPNQKDFRRVSQNLTDAAQHFVNGGAPAAAAGSGNSTPEALRASLFAASTVLTSACNNFLTKSPENPAEMKQCALELESAFQRFVAAAKGVSAHAPSSTAKTDIYTAVQELAKHSTQLVTVASNSGEAVSNPAQYRQRLSSMTQSIGTLITKMLDLCAASAPGQSEFMQATQILALALSRLNAVSEPVESDMASYFDCMGKAVDVTKGLATVLNAIMTAGRTKDLTTLVPTAPQLASGVAEIVDAAVHAAYLIGCADPQSVPGVSRILDVNGVQAAVANMNKALDSLAAASNQQGVLDAAASIGKLTNYLCGVCKGVSQRAVAPSAGSASTAESVASSATSLNAVSSDMLTTEHKEQFISLAQALAVSTQSLVFKIKEFAVDISPDNRQACVSLSQQLRQKTADLVQLSVQPNFAGRPAQFSQEGQARLKPIVDGARRIIGNAESIVGSIRGICQSRASNEVLVQLGSHLKAIGDSLKSLVVVLKDNAPGQRELGAAMEAVQNRIIEIDAALLQSTVTGVAALSISGQQYQQQAWDQAIPGYAAKVSEHIDEIVRVSKRDASAIASLAHHVPNAFDALSLSTLAYATTAQDQHVQQQTLDNLKEIGDAVLGILDLCKKCGGNPTAAAIHTEMDTLRNAYQRSAQQLVTFLQGSTGQDQPYIAVIENIRATMQGLESAAHGNTANNTGMPQMAEAQQSSKELVDTLTSMLTQAKTAQQVTDALSIAGLVYAEMVRNVAAAFTSTKNPTLRHQLETAARSLGQHMLSVCEAARIHQRAPDAQTRHRLGGSVREVSKSVTVVMGVLRDATKTLAQCETAITTLAEVILPDVEAAVVFAESGGLGVTGVRASSKTLAELKQAGDQLTKGLQAVESTTIVGEEEFGNAIEQLIMHTSAFVDASKDAAAALGSEDRVSQTAILQACHAAVDNLQTMILESMRACNKSMDSAEFRSMHEEAVAVSKHVATVVDQLEKATDQSTRPLRVLATAAADMDQVADRLGKAVGADSEAYGSALPDEVVNAAKALMTVSATLVSVSASHRHDEMARVAGALKQQLDDVVRCGIASVSKAPADKQERMKATLKNLTVALGGLYRSIQTSQEQPSPKAKLDVQTASKQVITQGNELVAAASALVPSGYVDPNDPDVVAERELLAAANAIDMAAKKLMQLQPPERPKNAPQQDLPFEEQIVEAAKAIAAATSAMIRSATSCQREIAAKGRHLPKEQKAMYFSDGTWSDGLVSAAKEVAASTQALCASANDAIKGSVKREKVIAAARAVAATTAQVITAASVRADPTSQSQTRLRGAGKSVTQATENLVKAAEQAIALEDTENMATSMKQDNQTTARLAMLEAQTDVVAMEKELERARLRLADLRKARYKAGQ
ncbi:hypothetical protein RI367_000343 [Sorochytrium milnesiophthora]